jgi:hypothetical protein
LATYSAPNDTSKRDFSKYTPDAVVVRLATHDFAKGDDTRPSRGSRGLESGFRASVLGRMFKIHEFSSASGELSSVYLCVRSEDARLEIVSDDGAWALPDTAVHAVLSRFGAPFDNEATISTVAELELPSGERLRHVRHLAGYDVIARDYIVYEQAEGEGGETLCAMSATVAAALLHLGRAGAASV